MIPGLIIGILVLSLILIKAADMVIVAIRRISHGSKAGVFTISAIILALGTSLPELFVGVTSALEGSPNLSLGVIFGSNIANIALIGGLTAVFAGNVLVRSQQVQNETLIAFLAGILPAFLASDQSLSRVDALIMLSVYLAYTTGFFRRRYMQIAKEQREEDSFVYRFIRQFNHVRSKKTREFGRLFIGVALLLATSDAIVRLSTILAQAAGLPLFLIGLFVIAIGTSLPELVFSLKSIAEHEPSMFFGNILGSTIANSTLVVGVTTLIHPLNVVAFDEYVLAVLAFVAIFISFWVFIRSKHTLERWEGVVLMLFYIAFIVSELSLCIFC